MPQNPISNLVVTKGGTIIFNVGTIVAGDNLDISVSSERPREVTIAAVGGGSGVQLQDGSGHTIATAETLVIGSGGTVGGSGTIGTISGFGGGGAGAFLEVEHSGSSYKISQSYTLANLPLSPVLDAVIAKFNGNFYNYVRPQGMITQPNTAGVNNGVPIIMKAGLLNNTGHGTDAYGGAFSMQAGFAQADAGNNAYGGTLLFESGKASTGGTLLPSATISAGYGLINTGGTHLGAAVVIAGAPVYTSGVAGPAKMLGGNGTGGGNGGNCVITPGTGTANGVLLVSNIPTADPHVLNAKFQQSISGVGWVGVYSQG